MIRMEGEMGFFGIKIEVYSIQCDLANIPMLSERGGRKDDYIPAVVWCTHCTVELD